MRGRDGERSSFQTVAMIMAIPLAGMAVFFLWQWLNGGVTPEDVAREVKSSTIAPAPKMPPAVPSTTAPVQTARAAAIPPRAKSEGARQPKAKTAGHRGDLVLIIDDLGFDGQPLERIMALDPNLSASILPNGTRASEFATRLNERGFEILCHLPMEPRGKETPGANAILTSMTDDEIARATRENIEAIPHARGVNNHMGSLATADRRVMESVLRAMPDGMYFIDSRTGGRSVARDVARELNVRSAARHVFLDDVATDRAVREQLRQLAAAAEKHGLAIGIGHPHAATLRVLAAELPALRAEGFRVVRASEAVR